MLTFTHGSVNNNYGSVFKPMKGT